MRLAMPEMPSGKGIDDTTPTPINAADAAAAAPPPPDLHSPPIYSILVICPQMHSREATVKHIKMTLPKDIPHQITALASAAEAEKLIGGDDPVNLTHVVVNLPSADDVISLADKALQSGVLSKTAILILSDSVQRQAIMKAVAGTRLEEALSGARREVTYIYKPVKPSRFAVIFDPAKERDLSIDRNRSTAQRIVETQKQSYLEMERRMGNKGYRVLLVEDNLVNLKVLRKYLKKVGLDVEVATDGAECTDKVFARDHGYYSLILCDLHMPRKDGYQACREIRDWEARGGHARMPIIALSANVMSDVQDRCVDAGFSDYVSKPVDFIDLSAALSKFF
jgi:CheY-like chemotaxis protein